MPVVVGVGVRPVDETAPSSSGSGSARGAKQLFVRGGGQTGLQRSERRHWRTLWWNVAALRNGVLGHGAWVLRQRSVRHADSTPRSRGRRGCLGAGEDHRRAGMTSFQGRSGPRSPIREKTRRAEGLGVMESAEEADSGDPESTGMGGVVGGDGRL